MEIQFLFTHLMRILLAYIIGTFKQISNTKNSISMFFEIFVLLILKVKMSFCF